MGRSNDGVYEMTTFEGKDATKMICKVMKDKNNAALGEVLALTKVGGFIKSGMYRVCVALTVKLKLSNYQDCV